jgi:chemotaxis protein CheX
MPMMPGDIDLSDLISLIWSTTLDLPLEIVPDAEETPWTQPAMQAQVHVTGEWQGVVVLHAPPALVAAIAQRMFSLGDQAPTLEDMQDAFGELANICGGNIKGQLSSGQAQLSLPIVVQGNDYRVSFRGSTQIKRSFFLCNGQPLVLTVFQASPVAHERSDAKDPGQATHATPTSAARA